jgi:hypothetical protein
MPSIMTAQEIYEAVLTETGPGILALIMTSGALNESSGKTDACGDYEDGYGYHSWGLFQEHDRGLGAGRSIAERTDPTNTIRHMTPYYRATLARASQSWHSDNDEMATWVYLQTEKPKDYQDMNGAAANGFRRRWLEVNSIAGEVMNPLRSDYLNALRSWLGRVTYDMGGKDPNTGLLDCSGYLTYAGVQALNGALGDPNWTSADGLRAYCRPIDDIELLPGDIVLFSQTYGGGGPNYATHCGVVEIRGVMLDCHDPGGCQRTNYESPYWARHRMPGFYRPVAFLLGDEGNEVADADKARVAELETVLGYLQVNVAAAVESATENVERKLETAANGGLTKAEMRDEIVSAQDDVANGLRPALNTLKMYGKSEPVE